MVIKVQIQFLLSNSKRLSVKITRGPGKWVCVWPIVSGKCQGQELVSVSIHDNGDASPFNITF